MAAIVVTIIPGQCRSKAGEVWRGGLDFEDTVFHVIDTIKIAGTTIGGQSPYGADAQPCRARFVVIACPFTRIAQGGILQFSDDGLCQPHPDFHDTGERNIEFGFRHITDAAAQVDFRSGAGGLSSVGIDNNCAAALYRAVAHEAVGDTSEARVVDVLQFVQFGRLQAQTSPKEDGLFGVAVSAVVIGKVDIFHDGQKVMTKSKLMRAPTPRCTAVM